MTTKQPTTITFDQFKKKFTQDQQNQIREEVAYYDLLMKFKDAREETGMTQEELAQKAQVNRTTLSRIETGMRNATIETLMKLSKAMGLEMRISLH